MEAPSGLRERKRLATWRGIRRAAFELFERDGFEAVSAEQIAAAAEVSRTTFFNYFPAKEAVVLEPDPEDWSNWRRQLAELPGEQPLWEALQAALTDYVATFAEHILVIHRLKQGSRAIAASSHDVGERFWSEIEAWAAERWAGGDAVATALRVGAARSVFYTAFELWEGSDIQRLLALLERGFAEVGAGLAASADPQP